MEQLSCQILVHAVAPEAQLGSLSPSNRHAATCALQSLRTLALTNPKATALDELFGSQPEALAALVQVYGIALREVAEFGGAAEAAAVAPEPSEDDFYSGRPPRRDRGAAKRTGASNSAAWAELLQCSAEVLRAFLARNALFLQFPNSSPHIIQNKEPRTGTGTRLFGKALSALFHGDTLPAVSRLLAAEVHRGRSAVLDTGAVEHVLWPLRRLVGSAHRVALKAQTPEVCGNQGQQNQQNQLQRVRPEFCTAVLGNLWGTDLVEHVCRYAVQRTALGSGAAAAAAAAATGVSSGGAARAGQQAAQGQQAEAELRQGIMPFTLDLVGEACGLACAALKEGGPSARAVEARAILSSAGLQYLLHLHVLSQLNAVDGSTITNGLSYDRLLPPVYSSRSAERGQQHRPTVLSCDGLYTACTVWDSGFGLSELGIPGINTELELKLLLRMASAAVRSWEHSVNCNSSSSSSNSRSTTTANSSSATTGEGGGGGSVQASSSGGSSGEEVGAAAAPAAVLEPSLCPSLAVLALAHHQSIRLYQIQYSSRIRRTGREGQGGSDSSRVDPGDSGGSNAQGGSGGGGDGGQECATDLWRREPGWFRWMRRRGFGATWWPLAVGAVRAELERQESAGRADTSLARMRNILRLVPDVPETQPAPPNTIGPSLEPPRTWLSAALSAGYIPCLEAFARRLASPTCRYPAPLASRASAVLPLLQGRWLGVLAASGEEWQAAALLVTAVKVTAVLAGQDATRRRALQAFANIPYALALVVVERARGKGPGAGAGANAWESNGGGSSGGGGRGGGSSGGCDGGGSTSSTSSSTGGSGAAKGQAHDTFNSNARGGEMMAGNLPGGQAGQQAGRRSDPAQGQRQPPGQLLRLLSLTLARWLPLCSALLPQVRDDTAAHSRLLVVGRWAGRLAELARAAAEARGDARASESWGRLLGACGGMGEGEQQAEREEMAATPPQAGEGDGSGAAGPAARVFAALAAALVAPCDVGHEVLPTCSNPLCTSLEGDSEAGLQLVACGGMCGGLGCDGSGPCCCSECARAKSWSIR